MIVVVIVGLLAAMAIPAFKRVRLKAYAARYANDFRQFSDSFLRFAQEKGAWPAATVVPGTLPSDMPDYLPASFTQPSPMGGGYTWSGSTARIRLLSSNATDEVMQKVDAILDDGDLSTGKFSKMASGGYHYQLD